MPLIANNNLAGQLTFGWRSSVWFVTLVVGYGVAVDLLIYSSIIPVIPFQLQRLGYNETSALTGWLLFAYSLGLVVSTPPIAFLSEKLHSRKYFMLAGTLFLIGSTIMFMEAPTYWVMILARVIQGISSSIIWIVGLALLCDVTPKEQTGRQLGLAMVGLTLGVILGPPIGGALFDKFGFKGPFVFCVIAAFLDGLARVVLIEKKVHGKIHEIIPMHNADKTDEITGAKIEVTDRCKDEKNCVILQSAPRTMTPLHILYTMLKSSRTNAAILGALVIGVANTATEPTLPLHLQSVWGLDPSQVGLVYIASAIPPIISTPLAGYISDRYGVGLLLVSSWLMTIPWWMFLTLQWHLAFFVSSMAVESFCLSGAVSILMAELASVSRVDHNIGFAHVYGAFNLAYGTGSFLGPIVAGQIYAHSDLGWLIILSFSAGLMFIAAVISFFCSGERSLFSQISDFRITSLWR